MNNGVLTFNQLFGNEDTIESIISIYKNKINQELREFLKHKDIKNYTEIYRHDDEWAGQVYVKLPSKELHYSLRSQSLIDLKEQIVNRFKKELVI